MTTAALAVTPATATPPCRNGRTFWWDRARCAAADAPALAAVIFDVDRALAEGDVTPRPGLLDLVDSLRSAGIGIAVATAGRRSQVVPLVRQLFGDGVLEVLVTGDDVNHLKPAPDVYQHTLHELGLKPESALLILDSPVDLPSALVAELGTVVVTTGRTRGREVAGAAAVRPSYDGAMTLDAERCRRIHDRWWVRRHR